MGEILEALMMLCFGASWPMQIMKTIKVKNPAGKSFTFLILLQLGYVAGIASKFYYAKLDPVILLYLLNFLMVSTDIALSLHYRKKIANAAALR